LDLLFISSLDEDDALAEATMTGGITAGAVPTTALCACSFINAYLMISVFPYAGFMVMSLMQSVTVDNAGTYAGLITSSFMAGRTLSAYMWGKAADIYGRVFVLNSCLFLSAIFSLLFGMASSFHGALVWRFCLGFANGIISTTKTTATELADGNDIIERRTMGLVIGMRSWGYLVSPAIGGLLSDPIRQYPGATWLRRGPIGHVLTKNPFLLPNVVACVACLVTFVIVTYFVDETLPESKRRDASNIPGDIFDWIQHSIKILLRTIELRKVPGETRTGSRMRLSSKQRYDKVDCDYGATNKALDGSTHAFDGEPTETVWGRARTRRHLLAHWMYSFVSMCADALFPLFCMSQTGGLGLTEASIGKILSGAGLLFAITQYTVFSILVHHYGEYTCLTVGSVLGIQPSLFIPLVMLLSTTTSELSWSVFSLLSVIMAVCKLFGLLYFASMALAINKTVPASQRGTMNGLVVTGASLTRAVAPTFSGALSSFAYSSSVFPPEYDAFLVYGTLSILAALVTCRARHLNDNIPEEVNAKEATLEIENVSPLIPKPMN
jgi:MFS family permease